MKVLAFDTETSIGKTIHGPTFRDEDNDIYTQIWATRPEWVGVVHAPKGFKRTLYDKVAEELFYADVVVGLNLGFDLCYIWNNKAWKDFLLKGGAIWDCQEAEYCLTGQQHTTASLAELQEKYLGEKQKPSRISYLYKKGIGADRIVQAARRCPRLFKLYEHYCKLDGTTPLLIFKAQYIQAKKLGMLEYIKMRMEYLLCQLIMTTTGLCINKTKAEHLFRDYTIQHLKHLQEAREILKSVWKDPRLPEFNVNSVDHKSVVFFGGIIKCKVREQVGYFKPKPIYGEVSPFYKGKRPRRPILGYADPLPRYKNFYVEVFVKGFGLNKSLSTPAAKGGYYSTADKVLKSIKQDKNTPIIVIRYCELQDLAMKYKKAANTYCKAFIERSVEKGEDFILHPHFNNTITPTGRLTSSEPNMQNIPSKSVFAEDLMGLLIAEEGWVCVSGDFSQLEKWTQAWVSGDINLSNTLLSGVCLHCKVLAEKEKVDYEFVYQKAKVEEDPVWDKKRTQVKPFGFLSDYGGSLERIAIEMGLTLEEVKELDRIDRELYPDKYKFFEEILPAQVKASSTYSLACNISASKRKGKDGCKIFGKAELLPIFDKLGNVYYNNTELRRIGYWQTEYGQRFHFLEVGRDTKNGIKKYFSMPKFKNYPNQGGASAIQAATTTELKKVLLEKADRIKLVDEIHDSKLFYIRKDVLIPCLKYLKQLIEDVPAIFMRRFGIEVPFKFPIEFKVGLTFSPKDLKKIEIGE